jgi:hypothetical protein
VIQSVGGNAIHQQAQTLEVLVNAAVGGIDLSPAKRGPVRPIPDFE